MHTNFAVVIAISVFSSMTFAAPNAGCRLTVTSPSGSEQEIAMVPVTISRDGAGTTEIGRYKNYTFNFTYRPTDAMDVIALEWTDGATASQAELPLLQGAPTKWCQPPVMLFTQIKAGGDTIKFECGGGPIMPTPQQRKEIEADAEQALINCLKARN